jgi:hypothetical protein
LFSSGSNSGFVQTFEDMLGYRGIRKFYPPSISVGSIIILCFPNEPSIARQCKIPDPLLAVD